MAGTDSLVDRGLAVARPAAVFVTILALTLGAVGPASAAPAAGGRPASDASARRGVKLAAEGNCVDAVPLLEEAEVRRHMPQTAVALAGCLVVLGDLVRAADLYDAVARERPQRSWTRADREAQRTAGQRDDCLLYTSPSPRD